MSLRTRLLAAFAYVLVLVIVALEVPLILNVSRRVDAEVKAQAAAQAQLVAASAAATWPVKMASGKFHGLMQANTPRPWRRSSLRSPAGPERRTELEKRSLAWRA